MANGFFLALGRIFAPYGIVTVRIFCFWGIRRPSVDESPSLTILGRTNEPTVHLALTSNVSGVTIAGDELESIHAPDGLSVPVGSSYTGLTARHDPGRTDPAQRFDSWQRVEGYDEVGAARWVELSRRESLDLQLAQTLSVRNPLTGELEIALQAHYVPAVRSKGRDVRSRDSGR